MFSRGTGSFWSLVSPWSRRMIRSPNRTLLSVSVYLLPTVMRNLKLLIIRPSRDLVRALAMAIPCPFRLRAATSGAEPRARLCGTRALSIVRGMAAQPEYSPTSSETSSSQSCWLPPSREPLPPLSLQRLSSPRLASPLPSRHETPPSASL